NMITLKKITLSAPAGSNKVKMKNLKGKFTCNLEIGYFYSDFLSAACKKAKKWRLENFIFPRHSERHFELKT
ncbi:MAG: hypothetical protein IJ937_05425, partial [Treponema sp.]|nr:hypothetical protein [Treponema sp.]